MRNKSDTCYFTKELCRSTVYTIIIRYTAINRLKNCPRRLQGGLSYPSLQKGWTVKACQLPPRLFDVNLLQSMWACHRIPDTLRDKFSVIREPTWFQTQNLLQNAVNGHNAWLRWSFFKNRHSQVDVAVLDFEKAFDKVAHHRLLRNLSISILTTMLLVG